MLFKGAFKTDNTNIEYKKKSGGEGGGAVILNMN